MIYLLHEDPTKNAQCLDDIALDKQIRAIAQTLCNAHYKFHFNSKKPRMEIVPPLKPIIEQEYSGWAITCRSNYLQLVDMGLKYCEEFHYRSLPYPDKSWEKKWPELAIVICWARDNVPQLPDNYKKDTVTVEINGVKQRVLSPTLKQEQTPFPLVMPEEYIVYKPRMYPSKNAHTEVHIIGSYRNYYRAKLQKIEENGCPCQRCLCIDDSKCKIPTFTRRKKPEWLNL